MMEYGAGVPMGTWSDKTANKDTMKGLRRRKKKKVKTSKWPKGKVRLNQIGS